MRKIFLLVITGSIALCANAQERFPGLIFNTNAHLSAAHKPAGHLVKRSSLKNLPTGRTTSTSGYWYDYNDSVAGAVDSAGGELLVMNMWPDTAAIFGNVGDTGYTGYGIPAFGNYYPTSMGTLLDPMDSAWVPFGNFIPPSSGYTIDSVTIVGIYGRPAGATYIDSLKLTFVYGNGDTIPGTTNMPIVYISILSFSGLAFIDDTATYFPLMFWDTALNAATSAPGVFITPVSYTFPLGPADTSVTNLFVRTFPVNFVVPDSNFTGMSVSFISGATSFPAFPAKDTVQYVNGAFKYGAFQPVFALIPDSAGWQYPPVSGDGRPYRITDNFGTSYLKYEGSADLANSSYIYFDTTSLSFDTISYSYYEPMWEYDENSENNSIQSPYVLFHTSSRDISKTPVVSNAINSISAYPNPASDAVTIAFQLSAMAKVTVSFTNVIGQQIDEQHMDGVTNGKVIINTSALPPGIYFYTVTANGQHNSGRVAVVH